MTKAKSSKTKSSKTKSSKTKTPKKILKKKATTTNKVKQKKKVVPEEKPSIVEASLDKIVDPRQQARLSRQQKKLADTPNIVDNSMSNVVPLRANNESIPIENNKITVDIPESLRWKLLYTNKERTETLEKIKDELTKEYKVKLQEAFDNALKTNSLLQKQSIAHNQTVNAVLDALEKELPEGYAVFQLRPEVGTADAEYNPMQAKARLPT